MSELRLNTGSDANLEQPRSFTDEQIRFRAALDEKYRDVTDLEALRTMESILAQRRQGIAAKLPDSSNVRDYLKYQKAKKSVVQQLEPIDYELEIIRDRLETLEGYAI